MSLIEFNAHSLSLYKAVPISPYVVLVKWIKYCSEKEHTSETYTITFVEFLWAKTSIPCLLSFCIRCGSKAIPSGVEELPATKGTSISSIFVLHISISLGRVIPWLPVLANAYYVTWMYSDLSSYHTSQNNKVVTITTSSRRRWKRGAVSFFKYWSKLKGKVEEPVFRRKLSINSCLRLPDHWSVSIQVAVGVVQPIAASYGGMHPGLELTETLSYWH